MKVGSHRFCAQLSHYHRDLTTMVSRVISEVLHQERELDLPGAEWQMPLHRFVSEPVHKPDLLFRDFGPL